MLNVLAIGAAIVRAPTLAAAGVALAERSPIGQPIVIVTLLALVALRGFLRLPPYLLGAAAVAAIALGVTWALVGLVQSAYRGETFGSMQHYGVLVLLPTA